MSGLRAARTKKLIALAFVSLMQEKSFEHLSVTDIAKHALINRQTFYNYYEDKFDLVNHLNVEMLDKFQKVMNERISINQQHLNLASIYQSAKIKDIFQHRDLILALLSINDIPHSLKDGINQQVQHMVTTIDPQANDFELTIYSNLFVTTLEHLLKNNEQPTPEKFEQLKQSIIKLL